jgi:ribonuclease P protein component
VKLAVRRSRIKRVIRESFRLARHDLPVLDVVVMVARNPGSTDVREELDQAWTKLNSLSPLSE